MALISTLIDNFNDNSIDTGKWVNNGGAQIVEANGQIEGTSTLAAGAYELDSVSSYDLTGSQATIKIVDAGNQSLASWRVYFGTSDYWWRIQAGGIRAVGPAGESSIQTYVAATYRYLKIREASGTVYFDYSSDGLNWTNFHSEVVGANDLTNEYVFFLFRTTAVEASTTTAKIDDFNILPSIIIYIEN